MRRSTERILTTHTGSLPRPPELLPVLGDWTAESAAAISASEPVRAAVADVVARRVATGIDLVSDGDQDRPGFCNYLAARIDGISGRSDPWTLRDLAAVPALFELYFGGESSPHAAMPACEGELRHRDRAGVERDVTTLRAALDVAGARQGFATAPAPGCIATHMSNRHYSGYEDYLLAAAEAMRPEYAAVVEAGLVLQLDSPDLGAVGHTDVWCGEFIEKVGLRRYLELNVEAINVATRDLDPESLRIHLCWGNYEGPHHLDTGLAEVLTVLLAAARPAGIGFEAANPRHEHEWEVFRDLAVPADKVIVPGVIDTTTNFVEHPRLVAQRIGRFAELVGCERVVAGADCGFGTFAGVGSVFADVVWMKLESLVAGAELASRELW